MIIPVDSPVKLTAFAADNDLCEAMIAGVEVLSIYLVIETMRVKRRFKLLIQWSLIFICRKRDCFDRA